MDPGLWELFDGDPHDRVSALIRLSRPGITPPGVHIVSRFGEIATCRLSRGDIRRVHDLNTVRSLKAPRGLMTTHRPEFLAQQDDDQLVHPVQRPRVGETGRGVLIGIVDWGCDFTHPDFRDEHGATRLRALWLQRGEHEASDDNPYGRGRILRRESIDCALASDDPFQVLGYHPGDVAPEGGAHGTHTMGIAAGNGLGSGLPGIAPDAELVFVQADSSGLGGLANFGDSVALLEAIDFIVREANNQPCVINLSMGRHGGPHDGSTLVELGLDEILRVTPGLAIVNSTGNYYGADAHACGRLENGQTRRLEWIVDPADTTPNELEVWYPGTDRFRVSMVAPDGEVHGPVELDERFDIVDEQGRVGRIYHRAHDPNNGKNHINIFLYADSPAGVWKVVLEAQNAADGQFDAWIERDGGRRANQSRFAPDDSVASGTTGTIANGRLTISVGAYDARGGGYDIAPFSSSGPTSDRRLKPELVAPGVRVLAPASAPLDAQQEPPALLVARSGTSMAAPHVAGTVALMFEAAPLKLSIDETRELLLASLDTRPLNEAETLRSGQGFLDAEAAVRAVHENIRPHLLLAESMCTGKTSMARAMPLPGTAQMDNHMEIQSHRPSAVTTPSTIDDYVARLDPMTGDIETGANRRLRGDEVRYLVLEGGGGKGLVYPGALRALQEIPRGQGDGSILSFADNRLRHIRGVAGSSAGAITAMALSLGMDTGQIVRISDPQFKDFDELFDLPAIPRRGPALGRNCQISSRPSVFRRYLFAPMQSILEEFLRNVIPGGLQRGRLNPERLSLEIVQAIEQTLLGLATSSISRRDDLSHKLVSPALLYYAQNLWDDQGLFSGCEARRFFDRILASRSGGRQNLTFAQHQQLFGIKLRVTGSNLETGRTGIFSADHTPHMAIADAVRISMGLPVLYKPVRISRGQSRLITRGASVAPPSRDIYTGLWVDGGLWNNLPISIFADTERGTPGTLGLALGNEAIQPSPINDLSDFLAALGSRFSGDEALTNRNPVYADQVITLDTGNLKTADFSPDLRELERLRHAAFTTTHNYFR